MMDPQPASGVAQRIIVVLGPHPGAAAAVTRMLSLLGVELAGPECQSRIVAINESVFAALGSHANDPFPLPAEWWLRSEIQALCGDAVDLLKQHFGERLLVGFEHCAGSRLLAFWNEVFAQLGALPGLVVVVHYPYVSNESGEAGGHPGWQSELLWLDQLLEAERFSRAHRRVFVAYEELLTDWRTTAQRIGARLGVLWPVPTVVMSEAMEEEMSDARDKFGAVGPPPPLHKVLSGECLRLGQFGDSLDSEPLRTLGQAYARVLLPGVRELDIQLSDTQTKLSEAGDRVAALEAALAGARERGAQASEQERQARDEAARAGDQLAIVRAEIETLYRSHSWRITKPLRQISGLVRSILRRARNRGTY